MSWPETLIVPNDALENVPPVKRVLRSNASVCFRWMANPPPTESALPLNVVVGELARSTSLAETERAPRDVSR